MRRTPLLTTLLWTSVSVAAVAACGDDPEAIVDAAQPDGTVDAFVGPIAQFPATLSLTSECGIGKPAAVDLTVTNAGNAPLTISGVIITEGFSVTDSFPIDVAPGASTTLSVRPAAAVIGTDIGGTDKTGTLSLQTNQPGTTGTVMLTNRVVGANLVLADGAGQPVTQVDLSSSTGSCPAPVAVFVRNTGNAPATVFVSSASGFSVGGFSPSSTVSAGSSISHTVGPRVTGVCNQSNPIQYTVTGSVCQEPPTSLQANLNISGSSFCFCS